MQHQADCTSARTDIIDVINRYGAAIDARNWPRLRSCFTPDATVTFGPRVLDGPDAIVAYIAEVSARMTWQQHLLGSHQVTVVGERASATSALHATQVPSDASEPTLRTLGTYHDELRLTGEGWQIARRELRVGHRESSPRAE